MPYKKELIRLWKEDNEKNKNKEKNQKSLTSLIINYDELFELT